MPEYERKTVKLHRAGGSTAITIPKRWLATMDAIDRVDLRRTEDGILVTAHRQATHSIEDEPEFARFLEFFERSAIAHPEALLNAVEVAGNDDDLFAGVELDTDEVETLTVTALAD